MSLERPAQHLPALSRSKLAEGVSLGALLAERGHTINAFWRTPVTSARTGFDWALVNPAWQDWSTASEVQAGLDHPLAKLGHRLDLEALHASDTLVALAPFGTSTAIEIGHALERGMAVHVLVAPGTQMRADLMMVGAQLHDSVDDLLSALEKPRFAHELGISWSDVVRGAEEQEREPADGLTDEAALLVAGVRSLNEVALDLADADTVDEARQLAAGLEPGRAAYCLRKAARRCEAFTGRPEHAAGLRQLAAGLEADPPF